MKKIFQLLIVLLIAFGLLIGLAFKMEYDIHYKYKANHSTFRNSKGIYPLNGFNHSNEETWISYYDESPKSTLTWILSNEEIPTSTNFENDAILDKPYHLSKSIHYNTFLFFWKNHYSGESDTFLNPVNDSTTILLEIRYYAKKPNIEEYFYCNLDTIIQENPKKMSCGNVDFEPDDKINYGNIRKSTADEIINNWGLTYN